MKRYEHGGNVYAHRGVVDFSASINPLGMPDEVVRVLRERVRDFEAYPDIECTELCQAIAQATGVPTRQVICTAGASDLIDRACAVLAPRRALVTAPCFSGYEQALERVGATIERHRLREEDGFAFTGRFLDEGFFNRDRDEGANASAGADIVFVCTPNNPTGLTVSLDLIERVVCTARRAGAVVVLDECFLDFTERPSAVGLCARYPNLVVMRAFTKMYAMAGLRLGYGICSDEELVARIGEAGQPWAVSTPAQVAGVAALGVPGWIERSRAFVDEQREVLAGGLASCGMRVIASEANYLLFKSDVQLYEPLLQRGFLIRRCANFEGLDENGYRIAVRTADENAALLAAIEEVCL